MVICLLNEIVIIYIYIYYIIDIKWGFDSYSAKMRCQHTHKSLLSFLVNDFEP